MAKAKRIKGIDCNDAAPTGIRLVLVTRFEEMFGFRQAALDWSDPEGVHSMRVASRRLRSAMRDFMPYLRQRGLSPVLKHTKSIAAALGEVRDHDVAIIALEKIEKHAPAEVSPALKQLVFDRTTLRSESRDKLFSALLAEHLHQVRLDFMERIETATKLPRATGPRLSYSKMSAAVILDRLKEFEKLSDSLYKPFDIEPLHEMRIAAKRLRYALELFQQCWGGSLQTFAKSAARMQTALGELHDCDVWIDNVGKQINQERKQTQNDQVAALMWLLSHFVKVRTKHLRQAYDLWCEWEVSDVSGQVRQAIR
ncbi:MAG TPA: CHAD domain-containing protein [Pyrinomonadaceae bacterium]|nr:CHAD domain-containing protein [Pyrinomonadaceae bacterium]